MAANANKLVLNSLSLQTGTWTAPDTIGTDAVRPSSKFSGSVIGSSERGAQVVNLPTEYAEALIDTPSVLFAKNPTRLPFTIEDLILEIDPAIIGVIWNRSILTAYAVTSPATETWDIAFIGQNSTQDCTTITGILGTGVDRCDAIFEVAMYSALFTPEDGALTLSGDAFASLRFKAEATPHSSFGTSLAEKQQNLGYMARQIA